jgi:hypothetical protein
MIEASNVTRHWVRAKDSQLKTRPLAYSGARDGYLANLRVASLFPEPIEVGVICEFKTVERRIQRFC